MIYSKDFGLFSLIERNCKVFRIGVYQFIKLTQLFVGNQSVLQVISLITVIFRGSARICLTLLLLLNSCNFEGKNANIHLSMTKNKKKKKKIERKWNELPVSSYDFILNCCYYECPKNCCCNASPGNLLLCWISKELLLR